MKISFLLLLCISCLYSSQTAQPSQAGESPDSSLNLNGYVQTWFSVAENQDSGNDMPDSLYGFSFRRIRFMPSGKIGQKLNWKITFAWDRLKADILDAYLDYTLFDTLSLRVGLFPVPGSISGALTLSTQLDCVERPMVTQLWSTNTALKSYRSSGLMLNSLIMGKRVRYSLMVANATGTDQFDNQLSQSQYTFAQSGLQFWGRLEAKPVKAVDVGAFFSNRLASSDQNKNNSYGANLFYNSDDVFIKLEYLSGEFGLPGKVAEWRGFWALFGYRLNLFTPVFRYDSYTPQINGADKLGVNRYNHITIGLNFDPLDSLRIQANGVFRSEQDLTGNPVTLKNNIFTISLQYQFSDKLL